MSDLARLLDPRSIAIAGLSSDASKHGRRVLANLRNLGFDGVLHGVNPSLPSVEGVEIVGSVSDLARPPDLVVSAVPASATLDVLRDCEGVGAVVVFAGGFSEAGPEGARLESALAQGAADVGTRMLGPNSGGIIRPSRHLAASFLTCLDRPREEIRAGSIGVVTQSGGTGSYLHNLAAARGGGLAVSISTGNEADIKLGEALDAISRLDEVEVVIAVIETIRDGPAFMRAVEETMGRGKTVVACRIGTGKRGQALMASHTGAMALPDAVLAGVLETLGVVAAETPGEAYDVAEVLAASGPPPGPRTAIVTHSGGMAILLADLAERRRLSLPAPGGRLIAELGHLLDHGAADNPLDMGGIIGGPNRFAQVVAAFAGSGEYDMVLAVSTAHPPAHAATRVATLLALDADVPVIHLWMAGDQADEALAALRAAGAPVTEEPRAAVLALAGLSGRADSGSRRSELPPLVGGIQDWGLPLISGTLATSSQKAVDAAEEIGYPVVVKIQAAGITHKTEIGGVEVNLGDAAAVEKAFRKVIGTAMASGADVAGARVERYRPGLEVIVGAFSDPTFGPIVSFGLGGVFVELIGGMVIAPAPLGPEEAQALMDRLAAKDLLLGFRGAPPADLDELARIISVVSRAIVGSDLTEVEINPLIWDGTEWVAVDWLVAGPDGSNQNGT